MTDRPSRDEMCMDIARVVSGRSTCSRAHVGVVIAREGRVLSTGYNGAPAGMEHCFHGCTCSRGEETYTLPGENIPHKDWCNSLNHCTQAVHAEVNAIAYAARHGVSLEGSQMYSTLSCCPSCAQIIINTGITTFHYRSEYRLTEGLILLESAGIALVGPS